MQVPFFSIIIPTLNEAVYLPRLLKDLVGQTFKDFEAIVVDAKSRDETIKKALKFENLLNLKIITSNKKNVAYQRNLGAKTAKSEILIFFDADTGIDKNFLEQIKRAFMTKNPDVLTTWIKEESLSERDKAIATLMNLIFELSRSLKKPAAMGSMLAVKKSALLKVGGFNSKYTFGEDSKFVQTLFKKGYKYIILRNVKYKWSLRRFKNRKTLEVVRDYILLNLGETFKSKIPEYPMGGQNY